MIPSQPIALLPHEMQMLGNETIMLIRPVEPQPKNLDDLIFGDSFTSTGYGPFFPDTRYYVQEEFIPNPYAESEGQPARFYRADDPSRYDSDGDWMATSATTARHFLTCESVEVGQVWGLTWLDWCALHDAVGEPLQRPYSSDPMDLIRDVWAALFPALPFDSNPWVVMAKFRRATW